jgi:transposase-like protein
MPKLDSGASSLASLLDGSSAGELIPELARHGLQQLIELEVAAVLGADRHERSEERLGYRNGYRSGSLTTQVGDIDLLIPIDRRSSACDNCGPAASFPRSSSPAAGWTRPSTP